MPVLTELVRDFNYEQNLINDGDSASITNTDWTLIKEYSNQIAITHDEQVLVFALTYDVPAGGALIKILVGGKTIWFKDHSAGVTDNQENFLAYLPAGTYSMQIYGKVKTASETLTVKSVKVGVTRLMDASKDNYENTDVEILDGTSGTVASRNISLPAKRTTPLGKTAKTVLRIHAYLHAYEPHLYEQTSETGGYYLYDSKYRGERIYASTFGGKKLVKVAFRVSKYGSPTFNVYVRVRRWSDKSLIATIGSFNAADVETTTWFEFECNVDLPSDDDVWIGLEPDGGALGNHLFLRYSDTDVVSWGNYAYYDGGWDEDAGADATIKLWIKETSSSQIAFKNSDETDESGKLNVRLKLGGNEVDWSTRHNGAGEGWAEKEAIVNLSDSTSTVLVEIVISNQTGGTRWVSIEINVYGSPWILPSELTDVIELSVPQNATIYVITEPLEANPTKTVGIGYLKAIPYTEELYAYVTGTGILEFHHTFDILKPVANMLKWRGKGASASILAADIRG